MNWIMFVLCFVYPGSIFCADMIFFSMYKKRKFYLLRLLVPIAIALLEGFIWTLIPYRNGNQALNFALLLVGNVALYFGFVFCHKVKFSNAVFAATAAMALEQIASSVLSLINVGFSFRSIINNFLLSKIIDTLMVFVPLYSFVGFLASKVLKRKAASEDGNLIMKIISASIVFICLGIYRFTFGEMTTQWIIAQSLYSITCCVFAFVIQFGFYEQISLRKNLATVNELYRQEVKHYEKWQESIDLINIKYHDLKYQITMAKDGKADGRWNDIEKALENYENILKTGNEILDNIISEKKTLAKSQNISLTCISDGAALNGMDNADIFALFGNALDNAVNAVKQVEDTSKRNISVFVRRLGEAVAIHIDNYYSEEVSFVDGLPLSSKDNNYHGFGIKSIKMITEKYNGTMSVTAKNNLFSLDIILFPGE